MVNEPVDGSNGHHGVTEDCLPLAEGLIGSDHDALALIAIGNQLEEDRSFRFGLLDIAEVIDNDEVKAVKLFKRSLKLQMQLFFLQMLNEVGG